MWELEMYVEDVRVMCLWRGSLGVAQGDGKFVVGGEVREVGEDQVMEVRELLILRIWV